MVHCSTAISWHRMARRLRVFLCGAHSTGKTTLLRDLANMCPGVHAQQELARIVIKEMAMSRNDYLDHRLHPRKFEFVQHEILRRQSQQEIICDTNYNDYIFDRGIDPLVYTATYLGDDAKARLLKEQFVQQCINRYRQSLIFVTIPHHALLVDDGFRMEPNITELEQYTANMISILDELDIPYHIIDKLDRQERCQQVLSVVDQWKTCTTCRGISGITRQTSWGPM